ncbi:3'-5' exonuclease [Pseudogulbenkiania ferrooxidans]|uniref:3'-5' exonuclease n=1 Tax=Pseudogulbenkiania ferrooxidans TaxID=549169 RepID=UPI001F294817|nr:3'-5' exonuclease [Pseudogulbenkiania ferrooxidans]
MTPILAFALATIPDVAGIRTLYGFAADIADSDVAEFALQRQRARSGEDGMPLHLQRIVAISWTLRLGDEIACHTGGDANTDEAALLQALFDQVAQHAPCVTSWSGAAFALPLLRYRALINGLTLPPHWSAEDTTQSGLAPLPYATVPLDDMARLCGFPALPVVAGGTPWEAYRAGRLGEIRARCDIEAMATYLLFLRDRLVQGTLGTADYHDSVAQARGWVGRQAAPHWRDFLAAWSSTQG